MKSFSPEAIDVAYHMLVEGSSQYGGFPRAALEQAMQAALDTDNVKDEVLKEMLDPDDPLDAVMLEMLDEDEVLPQECDGCIGGHTDSGGNHSC